jgi:hypothetical protein
MTKAQQYCNRLLQLGMQEFTQQTKRYRAFQHPTMRADQYVLVGKNGSLRTGSVSATSLALKPQTFFELLEQRLD